MFRIGLSNTTRNLRLRGALHSSYLLLYRSFSTTSIPSRLELLQCVDRNHFVGERSRGSHSDLVDLEDYASPSVETAAQMTGGGVGGGGNTPTQPAPTDDKKYVCTECGKAFRIQTALDVHMSHKHADKVTPTPTTVTQHKARTIETTRETNESTNTPSGSGTSKPRKMTKEELENETDEQREDRKAREREERERSRHKSENFVDFQIVQDLVEMWDLFAEKYVANKVLEPEEVAEPYTKYNPITIDEIKAYTKLRRDKLGYDEDKYSWCTEGIPLRVYEQAQAVQQSKANKVEQSLHFAERQLLNAMPPNPFQQPQQKPEDASKQFICPVCGKGYRLQGSLDAHLKAAHPQGTVPDPMATTPNAPYAAQQVSSPQHNPVAHPITQEAPTPNPFAQQ
eukprot:PhF_6_TR37930/c2_g1_i1/m.56702